MKIMSFNTQHCLNYISREIDFEIMAKTIKDAGADIIGLNEMRGKGPDIEYTDQTKTLSSLTGIENYYFAKACDVGGENPYGNAMLSKIPITEAKTIPVPNPVGMNCEPRCLLKVKLENGYTVIVIHFGLCEEEYKNAVQTILENLEDEKCILMGDFNVEPDNEVLNPIREKMFDTAELFKEPRLSWPSDNPTIKIDYMFVSRDIEAVSADISAVVASDHRPYIAEIK